MVVPRTVNAKKDNIAEKTICIAFVKYPLTNKEETLDIRRIYEDQNLTRPFTPQNDTAPPASQMYFVAGMGKNGKNKGNIQRASVIYLGGLYFFDMTLLIIFAQW